MFMQIVKFFISLFFICSSSLSYAGVPSSELSKINGFTIVDNEGEQFIAATDRGLFFSLDHGHSWKVYEQYQLPATMVSITPEGIVYAFVVTKGLLQLDGNNNQWQEISNSFGSQILTQLSATKWTPTRLVATNQYGKLIVSENRGYDWHKLSGPYQANTTAENRGQNLYALKCQSCHGKDGVGETYSLQALTDKNYLMAPALDASAHAWHHTDEALSKTILNGSTRTPRMAAWKDSGISKEDAGDLVAYIKSLWTERELDCQGPKHMQCMQ